MKKLWLILPLMIAFSLYFFACNKNEDQITPKPKGALVLDLDIDFTLDIAQGRTQEVVTDDFKVIIYNLFDEEQFSIERYADIEGEIELDTGLYYVVAHSNDLVPAAFESPYYYGESGFKISEKEVKAVEVTCALGNFMVTIEYSDYVKGKFNNWESLVGNDLDTLEYGKEETRAGYFYDAPFSVKALLYYTKSDDSPDTIIVTGIVDDPKPKTHYIITIDAIINGSINPINIEVDESSETVRMVFSNDSNVNLNDGLLALYPFNGNANDESGNGNHGVIIESVEFGNDRKGKENSAAGFSPGYIEVPNNTQLSSISQLTIASWIYVEAPYYDYVPILCKLDYWTGEESFQYRLMWNTANSWLFLGFATSSTEWQDLYVTLSTTDQPLQEWFHVAGTYDGQMCRYYINGIEIGSITYSSAIFSNDFNINIGRDPHGGVQYLAGYLDDLCIYNRALTPEEIAVLAM
ncbi:DUF4493 domain-containing protein [Bacteroidota bacterium]